MEGPAYPTVDGTDRPAESPQPRPVEERLAAALDALAARDRLLAERNRRLVALEGAEDRLTAATGRIEDLSTELAALRRTRMAELAERDARIAELEAVAAAEARSRASRHTDDLKQIRGIGPGIEALLHGIGITRFGQLADLSADQRDRVGRLLGVFQGRVERDDWVGQARALAQAPGVRRRGDPPGAWKEPPADRVRDCYDA